MDRSQQQHFAFPELTTLSPAAVDVVASLAAGLEHSPREARSTLLTLPTGARLIQSLRSPYTFDSEHDILLERERILKALHRLETADYDPLDALAAATRSPITMAWLYHGLPDHELRRPYGRVLHDRLLAVAAPDLIEPMPNRKPGKIRVGYLSPQLRNANSSRWAIAPARQHPREHVEVFALDVGPRQDHRTEEWKDLADVYIRMEGSVLEVGRKIREQDLDVLFFTDIGIDGITDVLGSMRLARKQATLWGGPCSSGLVNVDFYLGGEGMILEASEFSEAVIRLPGTGVYYDRSLIEPPEPGLERAPVDPMFFCMQTVAKCHPRWDRLLANVAEQAKVPILFPQSPAPGLNERTLRRFKAAGVRALFMPQVSEAQFTTILGLTSLSVDPPFYNGGITAILALAAGVPIVTMPGQRMRDRFGVAFLDQVGMKHWAASDENAYIEIALNWKQMKDELAQAPIEDLFEDRRVVSALNKFILG